MLKKLTFLFLLYSFSLTASEDSKKAQKLSATENNNNIELISCNTQCIHLYKALKPSTRMWFRSNEEFVKDEIFKSFLKKCLIDYKASLKKKDDH